MTGLRGGAGKGAIELRQVTKRYGKDPVVDGVSAGSRRASSSRCSGLPAPGKTTTLMMIAGFAEVDEGSILVDGVDIAAVPPQRRGFGMVFQNYAIFPHLNVFDNVAFPLRARKLPDEQIRTRVKEALELVRLERFADRFRASSPAASSSGWPSPAPSSSSPSVVLMDEPLGALDKNLRYQMQVEIKEIQQRLGMTVVYVTHDQEEAMNMSDRIAIMNSGRVEQVGRPVEIYNSPASNFIARFLGEANLIEGTVETIRDGQATLRTAGGLQLRARARRRRDGRRAGQPVRAAGAGGDCAGERRCRRRSGVESRRRTPGGHVVPREHPAPCRRHRAGRPDHRGCPEHERRIRSCRRPAVRLSWRPADGVILPR